MAKGNAERTITRPQTRKTILPAPAPSPPQHPRAALLFLALRSVHDLYLSEFVGNLRLLAGKQVGGSEKLGLGEAPAGVTMAEVHIFQKFKWMLTPELKTKSDGWLKIVVARTFNEEKQLLLNPAIEGGA